jgi:hypothetical protein
MFKFSKKNIGDAVIALGLLVNLVIIVAAIWFYLSK